MAQPALLNGRHIFVGNGKVYALPMHRLAGLYAPANGEMSTPPFELPATARTTTTTTTTAAPLMMTVNADVLWESGFVTGNGGCDEGCVLTYLPLPSFLPPYLLTHLLIVSLS